MKSIGRRKHCCIVFLLCLDAGPCGLQHPQKQAEAGLVAINTAPNMAYGKVPFSFTLAITLCLLCCFLLAEKHMF